MELNVKEQAEHDELHKSLVAQGGPNAGKLKAAGHKDPDGVARLIELGWVNPEEVDDVEDDGRTEQVECDMEFEAAKKAAEEAEKIASEAIDKANAATAFAKSKEPPACWRCGGDKTWHSTKTGYRAKTASEPLHEPLMPCPECK